MKYLILLRYTIKDIGRVFKKVRIPVIASIILGLDYDTPESIEHSIQTLIQNDIDSITRLMDFH